MQRKFANWYKFCKNINNYVYAIFYSEYRSRNCSVINGFGQ